MIMERMTTKCNQSGGRRSNPVKHDFIKGMDCFVAKAPRNDEHSLDRNDGMEGEIMEIIRFVFAAFFLVSGLFVLAVATIGLFRLNGALNRLHAAAKCDTLGALLVLTSMAILTGFNFTSLKILILIVFIWVTNPVSVFMIGRAEVLTNPDIEEECEVTEL